MEKSKEVTAAPIHTYFQDIRTSGRYLKINANSKVITKKEPKLLNISANGIT